MGIPEPRPSDLENPVPQDQPAPAPQVGGYFKDILNQQNQKAAAGKSASTGGFFTDILNPASSEGETNDQLPSAGNLPGGLFDTGNAITNAVAPEIGPVKRFQEGGIPALKKAAAITAQNVKDWGTNFMTNLHDDPKAALETTQQSVGKENAKFGADGKTIYFRAPGEKQFRPLSGGLFDSLSNLIANHSRAAAFAAGAIATEGLSALAAGGAEAAAVAPEAATFGARLLSKVSPAAIGKAATAGIGGEVAATGASDAAQNLTGNPSAPGLAQAGADLVSAVPRGAGEGALAQATLGPAFEALGTGFKNVAPPIKNAIFGRWQDVKNIYSDVQASFKDAGMELPETSATLGKKLYGVKYPQMEEAITGSPAPKGAIDQIRGDLSNNIDVLTNAAEKSAGDKKYSLRPAIDNMRAKMEKEGIAFNEKTVHVPESAINSKIPSEMSFDDFENMGGNAPDHRSITSDFADRHAGNPISSTDSKSGIPGKKVFIGNPQSAAFGERNISNVNDIVDLYNTMLLKEEAGGFSPLEATNFKKKMQGIFTEQGENKVGPGLGSFLKGASHDVTMAQKDILQDALGGSEEARGMIDSAYKQYSQRADLLDTLADSFHRSGSAEKVADDLVKNQSVDDVRGLKLLLDNEKYGPLWNQVRGHWFDGLVKESSTENILDPARLSKKLFEDTPKEKLDMMFSSEQQNQLKLSLQKLKDIPFRTFVKNPDQEEALLRAMSPLATIDKTGRILRAVFGLFRQNGPVADFMAGPGILRMAEQAPTLAEKQTLINTSQSFKQFLSQAKKTYNEKFGYSYVVPIGGPMFSKSMNSESKKSLSDVYGNQNP